MRRPKVHVHLDRGRGLNTWKQRWHRSEVFEEWPYGYQHAVGQLDLSYSIDQPERALVSTLRRAVARLLGFDLLHAWRNRATMADADMVWTHTEREHLAVALLVEIGRVPRTLAVLGQSVWLWDSWHQLSRLRRWCYRRLLRNVTVHTTHSAQNARIAAQLVSGPVVRVPYGTRQLAALPLAPRRSDARIHAVAPGNDRDRDWALLAALTDRLPDLDVTVLSRRVSDEVFDQHAAIRVRTAGSAPAVLAAYADADVVLVPLHPNHHASGITVAIEALNVGRPVVVADTGGLRDYLADHAWYYTPGDADSLAAAVMAALHATEAQRETARQHVRSAGLTDRDFALRHLRLTLDVLAGAVPDPSVSQFCAQGD